MKTERVRQLLEFFGRKLFRIRAMISFGNVQTGDLGGWVESESNVEQSGDAWVYGNAHWISIGPIGSENDFLTAFRQRDNSIMVRRGCFSGTIDEFESAVNDTHSDNQHGDIYRALILVIKLRLAEVEGEQGGDHA
ncbi:hypothetical protein LU631_12095 [Erwinia tracheiphila]|uniref:Uncharacterized protein n=2 Tax=Erwinia tracheiphila TaxID=65700 RepID=A0A0M2KFA8_9GAMM|nr:hypothetical protein [Erwinia tracheiphila]KKF35631.1 hypothetical protein SY86_09640 [Erwinia tracheiphila]UIA87285.1 hypothetical protein LU631_21485 [Erwinia tracheiphila]UIA89803.1 hypothetical protein LU631_12095 [Erwinia tracheiphila]UIA95647.1 hypothetical protein LU633_19930 [Erwinia tracheiphila]UIA98105.1 hypothetical protein LU633_10300 [Erwinia tracheiphila]